VCPYNADDIDYEQTVERILKEKGYLTPNEKLMKSK
jgi:hypothetical protein